TLGRATISSGVGVMAPDSIAGERRSPAFTCAEGVPSATNMGSVAPMTTPVPTDASFTELFPADAALEHLAGDFTWAEGPTYLALRERVVFSDVRQNKTWAWTDYGAL